MFACFPEECLDLVRVHDATGHQGLEEDPVFVVILLCPPEIHDFGFQMNLPEIFSTQILFFNEISRQCLP